MRARTHTEIYRPFRGTIRESASRALTLAWSGVRVGFKRKLPMLFLFAIPLISTIVGAFQIQLKFDALSNELSFVTADNTDVQAQMANQLVVAGLAELLGSVEQVILSTLGTLQFFVVLAMGCYGGGLIAEDKRLRANLLYFALIARWTYLRAERRTVLFWGCYVVVAPVTIMRAAGSERWSFLTDRWPVILKLEAYALLWVAVRAPRPRDLLRLRLPTRRSRVSSSTSSCPSLESLAWLFDGALEAPRSAQLRAPSERSSASPPEGDVGRRGEPGAIAAFCGVLTILNAQLKKMELGRC